MNCPEPRTSGKSSAEPPSKCLAIDLADKVHHDLVAILGLGALLAGFEILRALGQIGQRLVDGGIVRLHHHLLQLDRLQIDLGNVGQVFIAQIDRDIVAFFPVLTIDHGDLGLHRGAVAAVFEMLGHRFIDGFLHGFAQQAMRRTAS